VPAPAIPVTSWLPVGVPMYICALPVTGSNTTAGSRASSVGRAVRETPLIKMVSAKVTSIEHTGRGTAAHREGRERQGTVRLLPARLGARYGRRFCL